MAYPMRMAAEPIREVAFGALNNILTAIGSPTGHPGRLVRFVNSTDRDVYVSLDGVNNNFRLAASTFLLFDVETNRTTVDNYMIPEGQVFYAAYIGAPPTSGAFWIEYVIGD